MIIQLSSGQGPAECELAVSLLFQSLVGEYPDLKAVSMKEGSKAGTYSSIIAETEQDLSRLEGSVQWICRSPYRPEHKRKNWFVDISVIPECEQTKREAEIRFERFHCGGKGGQNVNKVETGVRLIHIPTGITVTSVEERSQYMNKKRAMEKLELELQKLERQARERQENAAWKEHSRIVRGQAVRVYEGMGFKLKK
ncbi:peptide chain release factor H [Clostridium sp. chh4-2]|uniref:peptide chain release factor H n=1 Tax=Clostridium sp. chh4-2 TaxID=2067550 RepID=UPI000CCFAD64|nr:peptide chain release factor H [Clostridium sp. chh4-2]PNV59787.1 peptide chain release factor H [Clostridium sp. chh4-2]